MTIIFLFFGFIIAAFQTLILKEIWQVSIRPKWLLFVITPLVIVSVDLLLDDQMIAFVFFGSMASVFLLAVIAIIFRSSTPHHNDSNSYRTRKSYSEIVKDYQQPVYLNPFWGIIYQLYVVVMILIFIFVPKDTYNSENNYQTIENDLSLQLLSLFIFSGFSIIILLYKFLEKKTYYLPTIFTTKKTLSTPKEFQINKAITIGITTISFALFLKFCYDHGMYHMLRNLLTSFNESTFFSINSAVLVFIIFNSIILFINPEHVAKRNMLRIVFLIRSAYISIFLSAAIVIPLMILEDKLSYLNMSSEIVLFLGFNFVLLINEISLFIKYRKGLLD
ncbi:hypothetical protein ACTS9D_04070 [Empedobacter brevis]